MSHCPVAPYPAQELLSHEFARCPLAKLGALQQDAPVHQVEDLPWYLVTRYDDCIEALRKPEIFSSEHREFGGALKAIGLTPTPETYAKMIEIGGARGAMFDTLLHRDPPAHSRQRRLITKALTARVGRWEEFIEHQVQRLLSRFAPAGEADFMAELAVPLPIAVIADILGVAEEHHGKIKQWSDDSAKVSGRLSTDEEWLAMARAMRAQGDFFAAELRKRFEQPSDDLVGMLAAATQEGPDPETGDEPLTFDEAVEMLVLLLVAGNETTTQLIGQVMLDLATQPGLLERMLTEDGLENDMVEESLRLATPIATMMRFVMSDTELAGVPIPKGSIVSICFNQANRDPAMFEDGSSFNPDREKVRHHLGFGNGIHNCAGARLARLEARITAKAVARHFAELSLPGPEAIELDMASMTVRGMTGLRLRYVTAAAAAATPVRPAVAASS
jgi:cytochrome P450